MNASAVGGKNGESAHGSENGKYVDEIRSTGVETAGRSAALWIPLFIGDISINGYRPPASENSKSAPNFS